MKKLIVCCMGLFLFSPLSAQLLNLDGLGNIDTIMEDNALTDITNRYSAIKLSYFPEEATRLGFESADNKLDTRTLERDVQALRALHIVQDNLKNIRRKLLSETKKTDYDTLQGLLALDIYQVNQNRIAWNPTIYSQAFDALYDLRIKTLIYRDLQDKDLLARINALPALADQAQKNLVTPPSFLSQLAMEDAYYAYLSLEELTQPLAERALDEVSGNQIKMDARKAKQSVKSMFDLFKQLAQDNPEQDFRLGEKSYLTLLQNFYFIPKTKTIAKELNKNLKTAQQQLADTLAPFEETALAATTAQALSQTASQALSGDEEVSVNDIDQQGRPNIQADKNPPLVTADRFYPVAQYVMDQVQNQNFISLLATEATNLTKFFVQDKTLPPLRSSFNIKEMPAYYAYKYPYKFVPAFGTQSNPTQDVLIRLPYGNEEAKQKMLNQDFNLPTLKLLMAGQIVPGLAYRAAYSYQGLSPFRKMYKVPTLRNGWEVYAQHLANERGYIITDAEQAFLAWADYVRAIQALADYYLHTQQMDYTEALSWLVQTHKFSPEQAQAMLKQVAQRPGEAVSYIYGYNALKNLRAKYQKKLGKKFSLSDFHAKVMSLGDIPPERLEAEMENAYLIEKNHVTQALSTPFYMN